MCGPRGQIDTGIRQHDTVHTALMKRRRRNHRSEGLINIEQQLRSIPQSDAEDVVLWKGKQDVYKAQFSTRDTWENIRQTRAAVAWHKGIWFNHATPKHRFCTWLATRNRLTTGDRMAAWNTGSDGNCVLCSQGLMETRNHLFFECDYSSSVWSKLMTNIMGVDYSATWNDVLCFTSRSSCTRIRSFLARYTFQATVYMIWRERNSRRHGQHPRSFEALFRILDRLIKNRIMSLRPLDKRLDKAFQDWVVIVQT